MNSKKPFLNESVLNQWRRTWEKVIIYTIICLVLFLIGYGVYLFLSTRVWQTYNTFYPILHLLNQWKYILGFVFWSGGILLIFIYDYYLVIHNLDYALDASKKIAEESEELIELPPGYKEIETQMNQTRLKVIQNARIAMESEQRKNDLVVYLAHDLKTPLTSVIGYLSLLHDEEEISKKLQKKYLSVALTKAERLEDLINEFFEITRFNLTHITLEKSKINLTRMLEQLVFEFQPALDEKNMTCKLVSSKEIIVYCDSDKMQRVLDNLLRNAINYSFPSSEIQIHLEESNDRIYLQFINQGNTILAEKLERIFEKFFRLDTARRTGNGGAGVGLAIAKEIVELHGGIIKAESENETIIFTVEIPVR